MRFLKPFFPPLIRLSQHWWRTFPNPWCPLCSRYYLLCGIHWQKVQLYILFPTVYQMTSCCKNTNNTRNTNLPENCLEHCAETLTVRFLFGAFCGWLVKKSSPLSCDDQNLKEPCADCSITDYSLMWEQRLTTQRKWMIQWTQMVSTISFVLLV